MGGDWTRPSRLLPRRYLNPPRPCGRGRLLSSFMSAPTLLKSAPPVWAGTEQLTNWAYQEKLKSAPPVWAGTGRSTSGPRSLCYLNPPRPCGRGLRQLSEQELKDLLKSAPPVWAGTKDIGGFVGGHLLKSAPPVWAGTQDDFND